MLWHSYGCKLQVAIGGSRVYWPADSHLNLLSICLDGQTVECVEQQLKVAILAFTSEQLVRDVAGLLGRSLSLENSQVEELTASTPLFGNLPELDSMAVVTVLTAIEDHYDILIEDDEVSGELFDTLGTLADFVAGKITA